MRTPEQIEEALDKLDGLLAKFDEANDRFDRGEWSKKYSEKFAPYEEKLKLLNGDDFDIMKESYDEYHKDYSDLSDDDYANSLEENIKKVVRRIWPEAEPEKVEQVAEEVKEAVSEEPAKEEIHIESEDKDGDGEISKDENAMEEKPSAETEQETDESEEDRFVKDLEDYKANMPRRNK